MKISARLSLELFFLGCKGDHSAARARLYHAKPCLSLLYVFELFVLVLSSVSSQSTVFLSVVSISSCVQHDLQTFPSGVGGSSCEQHDL